MDAPAGVTQEEDHTHRISPPSFCGACLHFFREKHSAIHPFPSSTVKSSISNFVYPLGHGFLIYIFYCFERENPSSCDRTEIQTHVPTSDGFEVTD